MNNYPVKKLAELAGVSIRTLHYYDRIGLLKPSFRSENGYRFYGQQDLLRLQQILFYRELGLPLMEIGQILDDPEFDLIESLRSQKKVLQVQKERIGTLLTTIDKTIEHLKKEEMMLQPEDLYAGLNKETATMYRKEAVEKYGEETILRSEKTLMGLGKDGFEQLQAESADNFHKLFTLRNEDPFSPVVQKEIAKHYAIIRQFWGTASSEDTQAEAYACLGKLFLDDERFTMVDGKPRPEFAVFLAHAMEQFSRTALS